MPASVRVDEVAIETLNHETTRKQIKDDNNDNNNNKSHFRPAASVLDRKLSDCDGNWNRTKSKAERPSEILRVDSFR